METVVQVLEYLETGTYTNKPNVDGFLREADNKAASLDDGLRICAARIARAMYSLRSKRSIAHKGDIDPSSYDLRFLLGGAQWILAELVRLRASGGVVPGVTVHAPAQANDLICGMTVDVATAQSQDADLVVL